MGARPAAAAPIRCVDPATGEATRRGRVERRRRRRRRGRRGRRRPSPSGPRSPRGRAARSCTPWPTPSTPTSTQLSELEVRNVGKPVSIIEFEMDLTLDNWRFFAAGAPLPRRARRRRVPRGAHVVPPPRPARRGGVDRAVELPAQHGHLEGRARARRGQHRGAQAVGAHAAHRAAPRRDHRRHPPARRAQRRHRSGRDRGRRARRPTPTSPWCRSPATSPPARPSPRAAADSLKRVHLELGGKAPVIVFDDADVDARGREPRRGRLLQLRPGLHRAVPRARRARPCTTTS